MLLFIVLAVWCASACAHGAMPALDKPFYPSAAHARHFEAFKATYNKQYATPEEERQRFEIFRNNLKSINELNAKYTATVYGVTEFSDLTPEEFVERHTGLLVDKSRKPISAPLLNLSSVEVPDSFDWRDKKVVTSVKDQGPCPSGWSFGLIGSLEGQYAIKNNKLVDFSEQQLIDCDTFDYGCKGGFFENALGYIMSKGVMKSADYPYTGKEDKCKYDANKVEVNVKSYESFTGIDENEPLKKILYTRGPIAVNIDAKPLANYKGGIFQDCDHSDVNHGVLLVGYGTDNGVDYWILKNSMGEGFGEKGYLRLPRGQTCLGLANADTGDVIVVKV